MLDFKQLIIKSLSWLETSSRKWKIALMQEKKSCAIARIALRKIMSAYDKADPTIPKTALETKMYLIAEEAYEQINEETDDGSQVEE